MIDAVRNTVIALCTVTGLVIPGIALLSFVISLIKGGIDNALS